MNEEIVKDFVGCSVKIKKKDGQIWFGELVKIIDSTAILKNKQHGRSAVSASDIEDIKEGRIYD